MSSFKSLSGALVLFSLTTFIVPTDATALPVVHFAAVHGAGLPVEKSAYVHKGRHYCFYRRGWHGVGYYPCRYPWRRGLFVTPGFFHGLRYRHTGLGGHVRSHANGRGGAIVVHRNGAVLRGHTAFGRSRVIERGRVGGRSGSQVSRGGGQLGRPFGSDRGGQGFGGGANAARFSGGGGARFGGGGGGGLGAGGGHFGGGGGIGGGGHGGGGGGGFGGGGHGGH